MDTETEPLEPPPPPPPPPGPPPEGDGTRASGDRLRRHGTDRYVAGVAGGLARYLGVDPLLVRIGFVVATFIGGAGPVAYALGWLLLPEDGGRPPVVGGGGRSGSSPSGSQVLGIVAVVALALVAMAATADVLVGDGWDSGLGFVAVALLVAGAVLVARRPADAAAAPAPTGPGPEPGPGPALAAEAPAAAPGAPPPVAPPRPRSLLTPLVLSLLALLAGVAIALDAAGAVDVSATAALSVALAIVGAALVVSAWVGRAPGLVVVGLLLLPPLAASTLEGFELHGGAGEVTERPGSLAELEGAYTLGAGQLVLDLRSLDVPPGRTVPVEAGVTVGELEVLLPAGADVVYDLGAGMGRVELERPGSGAAGWEGDRWRTDDADDADDADEGIEVRRSGRLDRPGPGTLRLDAQVGLGQLTLVDTAPEVTR